jgi:hypothetical protein
MRRGTMLTKTEFWVEWVDEAEMSRDYPDAARKGGFSDGDIARAEGFLDCCPPENYTRGRRFPSVALAKGWAKRNRLLDLWSMEGGDNFERIDA